MKKTLLTASAAASLMAMMPAAQASDLGLAGPSYDWAGGYIGINGGAALNNTSVSSHYKYTGFAPITEATQGLVDSLGMEDTIDGAAFTSGVVAGYNWTYGSVVLGLEGDFHYVGFDGSVSRDVSGVVNQVMAGTARGSESIEYHGEWFGTVRARAGYAIDNFLIYGTGGLAYGKMDFDQKLVSGDGAQSMRWNASTDGWNLGWTLGGGAEYAIDRWTLGAEYLYVDLGNYSWSSPSTVSLSNATARANWGAVEERGNADYAFSVVRATVKYRF